MKDKQSKTFEERAAAHLWRGEVDTEFYARLMCDLYIPAVLEQMRALSVLPSMKDKTPAELAKLACDVVDAGMQESILRSRPR